MVQILAVTADTAALNIGSLRIPRRLSVKDRVADVKADADRNALCAEDAADTEAVEMMTPAPPVALDFFDAGHQPRQHATVQEAEAAYRSLEDWDTPET
ncbi:hypothetical protein EPK99_06890 [Neorhizobium lilium]|uniref:Uncharacterized protein n=1 Tax=Neorhizobium lilium TaxID=2503024 RepID=A0A3S3VJY0_9HYPH|nr:hypothetical protein [Neorhizobium lilium]RWX78341.1 hypothetical protein EPK99_06890 [Neorhizobium lilium]